MLNRAGLQSHYQNWPGGKRDTDWISNIVPLKYAALYKVIMNCGTLLGGYYIFTREWGQRGMWVSVWVYVCSVAASIYFNVCVNVSMHSELMLSRKRHWFASDLVKRALSVSAKHHTCPQPRPSMPRKRRHTNRVFMSPWPLFLC